MCSKVFFCLLLVNTLYSKLTKCIESSPVSKDAESKPVVWERKVAVAGSQIEIRVVVNDTEEMNRLKNRVEVLEKSSKKTTAQLHVLNNRIEMLQKPPQETKLSKLRSLLNTMNATINSMKAQSENFSSYVQVIEKIQHQVNEMAVVTSRLKTNGFEFPSNATNTSYIIVRNAITKPLAAVTVCFWMKTDDTMRSGTPFSYSKWPSDNELLIYNYRGFGIWVNGQSGVTSISANDGNWHHICSTWQSFRGSWAFYKDGVMLARGSGLQTGYKIKEGGVLVLGQDQDREAGGFHPEQSFVGSLASVNAWSRVLSSYEIFRMSSSCALGRGDVITWSDVRAGRQQNVDEEFFHSCS